MKIVLTTAAAAAAALLAAAPALADPDPAPEAVTTYGALGYSDVNGDSANLGAITGRIGARWGRYFGAEGELSGGVTHDTAHISGVNTRVRINSQLAAYAVGYLPLSPNADLFARLGYGETRLNVSTPGTGAGGEHASLNYGVGGQYFIDGANGVRADYTRMNFAGHSNLDANVWSLAYVRKF